MSDNYPGINRAMHPWREPEPEYEYCWITLIEGDNNGPCFIALTDSSTDPNVPCPSQEEIQDIIKEHGKPPLTKG